MATEGNGGERVSYSTKELLERIEGKIDDMFVKLDSKADLGIVDALKVKVEGLAMQLSNIQAIQESKRFLYGWVPLALSVAINIGGLAYTLFHK